jgi:hypothetical protein
MVPTIKGKRVVVLSDHSLIFRAIQLALNSCPELEVLSPGSDLFRKTVPHSLVGGYDLIVVAVSSPSTEPVVALVRSSLVDRIGQVPLLIISDRPFDAVPEAKISHLRFPFEPAQLRETVQGILSGADVEVSQ